MKYIYKSVLKNQIIIIIVMATDIGMKLLSKVWRGIKDFFVPKYNELSVFCIALSIVLLSCFNAELENTIITTIKYIVDNTVIATVPGILYLILVPCLFTAGLILSLFHAFFRIHKSKFEKTIILFFALSITGIVGIIAGRQALNNCNQSLIVFPALNILTGILNLYLIGFADDKMMDDSDASLPEIFLGSFIIIVAFLICEYKLELHWSMTFSICITYAMNINGFLARLLTKKINNNNN